VTANNAPVAIQCKSCSKPIIIEVDKFHCVGCSVAMLHQTMAPRSKRERLRGWRKVGYELCIMVILFGLVNRYFGLEVQMVATVFFVMAGLLPHIGDRLSRIF